MAGWTAAASGRVSATAGLFFAALVAASLAAGALVAAWLPSAARSLDRFSFRFLAGFVLLVLAVHGVMLAMPWRIGVACVAAATALAIAAVLSTRRRNVQLFPAATHVEAATTGLAMVAITLWCRDYLNPIEIGPSESVVNAWQDIFLHVRLLSAFAYADGMRSVSNLTMAGVPAQLYHYASYIAPSALVAAGAANALEAFGGFMVPLGMALSAFAAFALLAAVFGERPAAAGTLALLLLPDASQQGFGNQLLAYHWLQAVAPGGLYGVATAALAWTLMLEACRGRSWSLVGASWAAALATLAFKAQIFVAIAYPILVFPAIFMPGLTPRRRLASVAAATAIFALAVAASQTFRAVPLMRLDGTGLEPYARLLLSAHPGGWMKPALQSVVAMPAGVLRFIAFGAVLLVLTLGTWIAYPLVVRVVLRRTGPAAALLPLIAMAAYVTMSAGLALDTHRAGQPEELLHRPFVWTYFLACTWTAAAIASLADERAPGGLRGWVLVALAITALSVPAHFGRDLQSIRAWMPRSDGIHVPTCRVMAAWHVRDHGSPHDLAQASDNDPRAQSSALAQRQAFAIDAANKMGGSDEKDARLKELAALKGLADEAAIVEYMRGHAIAWYIAVEGQAPQWPAGLDRYIDYRCGGYTVYRFPVGTPPTGR